MGLPSARGRWEAWLLGMSWPYAFGMLLIAAHLAWQTLRIDLARPEVNYRLFLANILTGGLLACTALIGTL
jgi:4-hydroxybenzoate polyprenyltransferase